MPMHEPFSPHPLFSGASSKLLWAAENIKRLDADTKAYGANGIRWVVEPQDPKTSMLYVFADPVEAVKIPERTGDIIRNLRGALDYAVASVFRVHGKRDDAIGVRWYTGDTQKNLIGSAGDTLQKAGLGDLLPFFTEEMNHTKAENAPVYWLNQIDRANKHRVLNIVVTYAVVPIPNFREKTAAATVSYRDNAWLITPGGMSKLPLPVPREELDSNFHIEKSLELRFGPSEAFPNAPIVPTLTELHNTVLTCLNAFQRKCIDTFPEKFAT